MQLIWFYYNSSLNLNLKIMERNFLVRYNLVQSSIWEKNENGTLATFSSSMQEAEKTGKTSSGVPWSLVSVAIQLSSQSCPVKTRHSRKLDNLVYLMDKLRFPFATLLFPSRIFPCWTATPVTAYLVSQHSYSLYLARRPFLFCGYAS